MQRRGEGDLRAKKNLRLLTMGALPDPRAAGITVRSLAGGLLVQSRDNGVITAADVKVVSKRQPTPTELADLLFAFKVAKHVKSNAIVYVKDGATVGIGAGQMSRVDSARIAALKAADAAAASGAKEPLTRGSVVASDAFFPFADGLLAAAEAGATAVIQPGGSMRDAEVIAAADDKGLAMVFHRHAPLPALSMADDGAVRLRRASRADWDLIRGWLARPDIEAWWGPRSATEAEVNIALNSEHALCRIIEAGGTAIGYAHAVDATMWGEELPQDLEPGTWDLDLFIASEEHRGQGRRAVRAHAAQGRGVRHHVRDGRLHLSIGEKRARGKGLRKGRVPLEAHLERPAHGTVVVHGRRAPAAIASCRSGSLLSISSKSRKVGSSKILSWGITAVNTVIRAIIFIVILAAIVFGIVYVYTPLPTPATAPPLSRLRLQLRLPPNRRRPLSLCLRLRPSRRLRRPRRRPPRPLRRREGLGR